MGRLLPARPPPGDVRRAQFRCRGRFDRGDGQSYDKHLCKLQLPVGARMSAHVLPDGGGRTFGPGINVKIEYGQSDDFAAFESELPPAWDGPPPHLHRVYDEAFYVIAGKVAFSLNGDTRDCATGSFVFVPRGVAHGFANPADEPARILVITSPGAIQLVEAIYDLSGPGGPPDFEAMAALYASHESEVLGAPPQ